MKKNHHNLKEDKNGDLICSNCHAHFKGNYCPNCGQSVKDLNRPFNFVLYDFAGTIFAFDTRVLKSLRTLLFSPGKLSLHFVEGTRARYMPPFQLFVFISFIFFLTLSVYTQRSLKTFYNQQEISTTNINDSVLTNLNIRSDSINLSVFFDTGSKNNFSPLALKNLIDQKIISDTSLNKEDYVMLTRISRLLSNPNVYFATIFKYLSWGIFFLMPVFALMLLIFFNTKGYYYTAHLTFSINLHTFLFLTFFLILLIRIIFHTLPGLVLFIFLLQFIVYELIAIKRFYRQNISLSIVKLLLLNVTYSILFFLLAATLFILAFFNI